MKKLLLLSTLLSNICLAAPPISMIATTTNAYGLKDHNVWTYSQHDIEIINDTDEDKNYSYGYSLCVQNHGCQSKDNTVTVKPHQRFNNHCELSHEAIYKYSMPYEAIATTRVSDQSKITKALVIIRD